MIGDWIARLLVGFFWTALVTLVLTVLAAFLYLLYLKIGWQGYTGFAVLVGTIATFAWAFERNSDRKYKEGLRLRVRSPSETKVYDLDQKLDRSEELL